MKVLNMKVFCVEVYCLYNPLKGDSRGFIYTSKAALYIDKEGAQDRTIIIITAYSHYFILLYVTSAVLLIIY